MGGQDFLAPNYSKLDTALRSIGYTFESAVADVVDNSIDAGATEVHIRLVLLAGGGFDLVIRDNGFGMEPQTLREAMRFGADVSQEVKRLGKFGLGLKLASLSQAKELRVYSAQTSRLCGMGWLEDGIRSGFKVSDFNANECETAVRRLMPDVSLTTGTLVHWASLYRVGTIENSSDEHAQKLLHRLQRHTALAFHRFLSGIPRRVSIKLDILDLNSRKVGIPVMIEGIDPFGYDYSGHPDFPTNMTLEDGYSGRLTITAHIWPANSTSPEYKLKGGANSRQGFYFYRNNRLIQGGGWNGIREVEPHYSLARLSIDMAPDFDVDVSLDVKKVEIQLPVNLIKAIQNARTPIGVDFKKYLSLAESTYRTRSAVAVELPVTIGKGIPAQLRDFVRRELAIKEGAKNRAISFEWVDLSDDSFFEIDKENDTIYLNRAHRHSLLHGLGGSSADVPVLKCILFLLLKDVFEGERMGSRIKERVEQANRMLCAAVNYERTAE